MKISKKKLLELIGEVAADEFGGPTGTQYAGPDGEQPSLEDAQDADMLDKQLAGIELYKTDREEAQSELGEFDGGRGDPYTYNYDDAARRLTARIRKVYATAATKYDPSNPDADPITGHVILGKSFRVPETSTLYTQVMDKYGSEIEPLLVNPDRVTQVDDGSSSGDSSDSSSASLDGLFEAATIQKIIKQEIVGQLVSEVNLNKILKKAEKAKTLDDINKLIDDASKKKLKPHLRDAALAGLENIKQDMLTKLGDEQDRTADPDAVAKVMQKLDSDRQAQVEPAHNHGKFEGGRGDPYTYDYLRWDGEKLMAMARTKTDKETGEIEQIDKIFAVSPASSLHTQMMADEDIMNAKPDSDTVASSTGEPETGSSPWW